MGKQMSLKHEFIGVTNNRDKLKELNNTLKVKKYSKALGAIHFSLLQSLSFHDICILRPLMPSKLHHSRTTLSSAQSK